MVFFVPFLFCKHSFLIIWWFFSQLQDKSVCWDGLQRCAPINCLHVTFPKIGRHDKKKDGSKDRRGLVLAHIHYWHLYTPLPWSALCIYSTPLPYTCTYTFHTYMHSDLNSSMHTCFNINTKVHICSSWTPLTPVCTYAFHTCICLHLYHLYACNFHICLHIHLSHLYMPTILTFVCLWLKCNIRFKWTVVKLCVNISLIYQDRHIYLHL